MVKIRDRVKAFLNPEVRSVDSLKSSFSALMGELASGIVVNEETALRFSAVWQAIRILSELPASLPIETIEEKGNTRTPIEHDAKQVLMYPNVLMNRFTWHELMNAWLQGWGNGVSIIDSRRRGIPELVMPVHPASVEPKFSDGRVYYKVDDRDMGIKGTFFAEEVIHYKGFTTSGFWGKSPIQVAKDNLGLSMAAEKFGAKYFKKGGNLKAVLETEGHMKDEEFKAWKKRWEEVYSGDVGDHSTPILEFGMKYKSLGVAPEAAQFIQTRQFGIQDVARWFNLPPHMLGDLSRATFSNIEHQDLQFVKYCLRPLLRRQEIELEEKLLRPEERGRIKIRYNLDGMLRGDLASQTQHIKEMVQIGVLSPDEGRALLNRNPRPGGADYYEPANITGKKEEQ